MPPQDKNLKPRPPAHPPKPGPTLGGTLGIIAIAVSVGVIASFTLDLHSHTCSCGNRWWHLGAFAQGSEPSHTCGRCGTLEWFKSGVPAHLRQAHAHDSWAQFMGDAFDPGSTGMRRAQIAQRAPVAPIIPPDSMALVRSKDRP